MFGIGPLELLILGGMFAALLAGAVVLTVVLLAQGKNNRVDR